MFVCICTIWFIWWIYTASLRKFSKFGVWQMFSKFGLCLKTIQNVLNLFEQFFELFFLKMSLYISLNLFWKCLWTFCWKITWKRVWKLLDNFQNVFKEVSKQFGMIEKIKDWQMNNLQLLSVGTRHWGNDCRLRHPQITEKRKRETCLFCTARKFQHFHRARSARTGAKRPGRHKQEAPKDPPKTRQAPNFGQKVSRRVAEY